MSRAGWLVAAGAAAAGAAIGSGAPEWAWGAAAGLALQRSRFCFASALRDSFGFRLTATARAAALLLLAAAGGAAAVAAGRGGALPPAVPPSGASALGGLLFGAGMVMAGNCAAGTLCRLGEGHLTHLLTLVGLVAGAAGARPALGPAAPGAGAGPVLPAVLGWPGALAATLAPLAALLGFLWWLERRAARPGEESPPPVPPPNLPERLRRPWPEAAGALVLAGLWTGYLASTGDIWRLMPAFWSLGSASVFALGLVGGGALGAAAAGEFRWRTAGRARDHALKLAGGLLMGVGGRLGSGCTIGALLGGVAGFSPHGWLWLAGSLASAYAATRWLFRIKW